MKTIEELIAALEGGEYQKINGQFKLREPDGTTIGYCCLGVYGTICGLTFPGDQAIFGWPNDDIFVSKVRLPEGHWLLEQVHVTESSFKSGGYDVQFQSYLTDVNDDSEDIQGFTHVVRALRAYAAGQRAFPPASTFVEEVAA